MLNNPFTAWMLTLEQIKLYIESPQNKDMLARANQIRIKHQLHVSGIGLDNYLDKIQGVENQDAVSLRRALGKVITQPEINKIISVENKIFSARGGGKFYQFSNDNDKEAFKSDILSDVKDDMSMRVFMQKVWRELVNIDPSGLFLTEIDKFGELEITYKSSACIYDIGFTSSTSIDYIIFQPKLDKKTGTKIYRIIDDEFDYLVAQKGSHVNIIDDLTFINPFGYVPACFISDRFDKKSTAFTSHIEESLIYADDMLLDYTIYKVYKVRMGIPYHWQYELECATCNGSGNIIIEDEEKVCSSCGGDGYTNKNRDVADMLVLPLPEDGDVALTPPTGFVQADLPTWKQYEETIEKEAKNMFAAVWGESANIEGDRRNITVGELAFREFSKENKLNEISDNEETVERFLTDLFGIFHYPNTYQGAIINNGRNYDLKSPDQLMEAYMLGLEKGLGTTDLTKILESYYHSVYNRNPKKLNESLIKINTKPFYHWQPEKMQAAVVNEVDYLKNIYFDEFCVWYNENVESFGITTLDKVQKSLNVWIVDKLPKPDINIDVDNLGFSQEQLDSQATLRGSVGGVQGVLALQASVQIGTTDHSAAIETLKEIYGFSEEKAKKILGTPGLIKPVPSNGNAEVNIN